MTKETKDEELSTLVINDTEYSTRLTEKFKKRVAWTQPDSKMMYSYLPGTVLSIDVKVGDKVEEKQALMKFEAMKMVNTVKSKAAGTVKKIHIKVGDKMPKNLLMIELE
jgi:biotin carboxyl carrier protein